MNRYRGPRLCDPRARLWLGLAVFVLTRLALRPDCVGPAETRLFRKINDLPDVPTVPVWLTMQPGALGAVPAAAVVAHLSGRRHLAKHLLLSGLATWALSKVVKKSTARPRPGELLADTHRRGPRQSGLGFVSGHAGVVTSLCLSALPELPPPAQAVAVITALGVALGRMYTGAHLPLDIAGGVALGVVVEAAVEMGVVEAAGPSDSDRRGGARGGSPGPSARCRRHRRSAPRAGPGLSG
jgi:undecaprenyl-diphosphatase